MEERLTRNLINDLGTVGGCTRCKRGLLRSNLPICAIVQRYYPDKSIQEATRQMMMGHAGGYPPSITSVVFATDVHFQKSKEETILCTQCSVALEAFLDGLSEDEEFEYAAEDALREGGSQ